jgi:two-component system OmpR family sensor kinase
MGMQGQMVLASQDQAFLDQVNRSIIIGGVVAGIVAIAIGLILTSYFTKPIRELKKGARSIANGDLSYKVAVQSKDELGELAKSFNTMAESLNNSEQARQRLFADIAHELRTPLSVIEGTVDAMLDGVFEQNTANLNSIKEETTLLTRLIADLRDLTLAESGQLKLTIEPTDIANLIQRRAGQSEVIAREKNITLATKITDGLPNANVDGGRIDQVVTNLISNAIKNTPPDGDIHVTVTRTEGNESILVSVTDTGEGISDEDLPHIFDRFYRVDEARSRKVGGAGLGLAIAKQMIKAHGGKIWAKSEVGKGSTFYFTVSIA